VKFGCTTIDGFARLCRFGACVVCLVVAAATFVFVGCSLLGGPAWAQSNSSLIEIRGRVIDPQGLAVDAARVTLTRSEGLTPTAPVVARTHRTPAYPIGVTGGVTFHLGNKQK